jgi:hypothetical protein
MPAKTEGFIKGPVKHRRTESDYMSTLLEVVTLEEWRAVVEAALTAARAGDARARDWLAQYLVGKSGTTAQSPIEIVARQISGQDPLVAAIAQPHIISARYPELAKSDKFEEYMRILVAGELMEAVEAEQKRAKAKATRAKKRKSDDEQKQDSAG